MIKKLALALTVSAAFVTAANAQIVATDNASNPAYDDGWAAGDNGGTGFGAWTTVTQGFIGSSNQNGNAPSGNIDTGGESFGLFSNTGAPGTAQAIRPFSSALTVGQTFSLDFDNGFVASGGAQGFSLLSGGTIRFEFYFAGGSTSYTVDVAAGSDFQTAHGFTTDGMNTAFTLTSPDTFTFTITYNSGTPTTESFSGSLSGAAGTGIDSFRLFNANANQPSNNDGSSNAYFNSPTVVPEPSSLSLLAGPAILGAWFFVRRRRA